MFCCACLLVHRQGDGHSSCSCGTGSRGVQIVQKTVEIAAVDVPVLVSDKFQQSTSLLCYCDALTVQTVQKTAEIPPGACAVLGGVDMPMCCATTGARERAVHAAMEFHSCSALAVRTAGSGAAGGVCLLSAVGGSSSHR